MFLFNISETVFGDTDINLIHTALVNNVKNIQLCLPFDIDFPCITSYSTKP